MCRAEIDPRRRRIIYTAAALWEKRTVAEEWANSRENRKNKNPSGR